MIMVNSFIKADQKSVFLHTRADSLSLEPQFVGEDYYSVEKCLIKLFYWFLYVWFYFKFLNIIGMCNDVARSPFTGFPSSPDHANSSHDTLDDYGKNIYLS